MPRPGHTIGTEVTEKPRRGPLPGEPILLKENPAQYLVEDAERAVEGSRGARDRGDAETEASCARLPEGQYSVAARGSGALRVVDRRGRGRPS
jgi:hypothetical protein